jgi:predicted nucleic acid-binding protein
MRLLVDTNIFLEVLLEQARSEEAKELLAKTNTHDLFISDFSLHSVGLILLRQGKPDAFRDFLTDMVTGARVVMLHPGEIGAVTDHATAFNLDFDDAYQYAVAEKYNLIIVSFDKDFDRTTRGRSEPSAIA